MSPLHLFRIFNVDGSVNRKTAYLAGGAVAVFLAVRLLGEGTHDAEYLLGKIEAELAEEYRNELVKKAAAAREADDLETAAELTRPLAEEAPFQVVFEDVAFSAPLLRWGIAEDVGVRFRYKLLALGEPVEQGQRYVTIQRAGFGGVRWIRKTDAIGYFLHFI